jgi:hypothetical protein
MDARRQKENTCLQLLRTSDYERYKDRNPCPVPGTCKWFLGHDNYTAWRDNPQSSLLWVSADPGCGKSVLARFLVDRVLQTTKDLTICYFFFKDDNEKQKTVTNALCALLHQIFIQKNGLLEHAISIKDQNGDQFTNSVDLLWKVLLRASEDPRARKIVCILDALDECRFSELQDLLQKVCAFYNAPSDKMNLKFLVTSRPLQHIAGEFSELLQKIPTIKLAGEENTDQIKEEIDLVIEAELEKIEHKWKPDPKAISLLRQELAKVEHRTYLWLKLVFDLVHKDAHSMTKQGRLKIFGTIPDSVNTAYSAILNQSRDKEQTRKLLQIICVAIRPLTAKEMGIAMTVQEEDKLLHDLEENSDDYYKILIRNLCGLFVSFIDGKVYLLHQTAKEFLISKDKVLRSADASDWAWKQSIFTPDAHSVLAHICIWYLRLEGFLAESPEKLQDGKSEDDFAASRTEYSVDQDEIDVTMDLVARYAFFDYAATHWATHFRQSKIPKDHISTELVISICSPETYPCPIWIRVLFAKEFESPPSSHSLQEKTKSLHILSFLGLEGAVSLLLARLPQIEGDVNINSQDKFDETPLHWAIEGGHADIVILFLAAPNIDINK